MLFFLVLSSKSSLILSFDSGTSSEFRSVIRVAFIDLVTLNIIIKLVFFNLRKVPKTSQFRIAESNEPLFLPIVITNSSVARGGAGGARAPPIGL